MIDVPFVICSDEIRLRSDKHNYTIYVKKKSSTEKLGYRWVPDKYYASLQSALHYVLDQRIKHSDAVSVKELIDTVNKHYYDHLELFKKLRD